ncbi:MAG TPA: BON domain-containing protein [Chloroflexota bacterium]|nr:BON domain-containing protein [Chloroflexota bacterium]
MAIRLTDPEIRQNILDALSHDARLDPRDITVSVTDGTVYLAGTVPTYAQKVITVEDARRIKGVLEVVDDLKVRLPRTWTDQEIGAIIRRKLDRDSRLTDPSKIDIAVNRGVVTLSGIVPNYSQRVVAEEDVWAAPGVVGVINNICLAPPTTRTDDEIAAAVREALDKDPAINAARITVTVEDGVVYLRGSVPISYQSPRASGDAWSVPGVRDVVNELIVGPRPVEAQVLNVAPTWIGWARLASLLSILVGVWVVLSPFVLGYASLATPAIENVAVGVLVVALAAVRFLAVDWAVWPSWAVGLLGLWLAVSPLVLGYVLVSAPTTNDILSGGALFVLGVVAALATAMTPTRSLG